MLGAGTQARETAIKEDLQLRSDDPKPIVPSPLFRQGAPIESYNP